MYCQTITSTAAQNGGGIICVCSVSACVRPCMYVSLFACVRLCVRACVWWDIKTYSIASFIEINGSWDELQKNNNHESDTQSTECL
jgi:hypothetical protein